MHQHPFVMTAGAPIKARKFKFEIETAAAGAT
jgi:hypothetical protein